MGACDFQVMATGRSPQEAFSRAVDRALWESGHGGYTGTIAEKNEFILIELPPRVASVRFLQWIESYQYDDTVWEREELERLESLRAPRGQGEAWKKRKASLRAEIKRSEQELKKIPEQHRRLVEKAAAIYAQKWGPALAFELPASESRRMRKNLGMQGKHMHFYYFCGLASS